MNQISPTQLLGEDITASFKDFSSKRRRDKRKAFRLKMGAAVLAASITVLLGLKVASETEAILKNVALFAGALVAVLNAWDAFYDHRSLWVKRTAIVAR